MSLSCQFNFHLIYKTMFSEVSVSEFDVSRLLQTALVVALEANKQVKGS